MNLITWERKKLYSHVMIKMKTCRRKKTPWREGERKRERRVEEEERDFSISKSYSPDLK